MSVGCRTDVWDTAVPRSSCRLLPLLLRVAGILLHQGLGASSGINWAAACKLQLDLCVKRAHPMSSTHTQGDVDGCAASSGGSLECNQEQQLSSTMTHCTFQIRSLGARSGWGWVGGLPRSAGGT
jgi:hypothetical protein